MYLTLSQLYSRDGFPANEVEPGKSDIGQLKAWQISIMSIKKFSIKALQIYYLTFFD